MVPTTTSNEDNKDDSEGEICLNKSDQEEQELDQIYLRFLNPKTDSEIKETLVYKLKKHLDSSQSSVYCNWNFLFWLDKSSMIQKFIDKNLIIVLIDILKNENPEEDLQVHQVILIL